MSPTRMYAHARRMEVPNPSPFSPSDWPQNDLTCGNREGLNAQGLKLRPTLR